MSIRRKRTAGIVGPWIRGLFYLCQVIPILSSTPNVEIQIGEREPFLAKRGVFGNRADRLEGTLVHAPIFDPYLCEYYEDRNYTVTPVEDPQETYIMMAARGFCTFEKKAFAAKTWYKAKAVFIYDNLEARYRWNNETQTVIYPEAQRDYECDNGFGTIDNIELDPPRYSPPVHDPLLDQLFPNSTCVLEETRQGCESQLCVVTGPPAEGSSSYPVCCAWDLPITMLEDSDAGDTSDIMAVALTIRQGQVVLPLLGEKVTIQARPDPNFNISLIFLWALGTAITWIACYFPSSDLRVFRAKLSQFQKKRDELHRRGNSGQRDEESGIKEKGFDDIVFNVDDDDESQAPVEAFDDEEHEQLVPQASSTADRKNEENQKQPVFSMSFNSRKKDGEKDKNTKSDKNKNDEVLVLRSLPPPERKKPKPKPKKGRKGFKREITAKTNVLPSDSGEPEPEPWAVPVGGFEMTQWHVFGFVIISSITLFLLFFLKFYNAIFILYGIGCAGSVSYLIFAPLLTRLARMVPVFSGEIVKELNKSVLCGISGFDITSQLLGYLWAILFIWYGLSHYRPSTNAFFWISINVFGACFCVFSISMLRLQNIKIATMLLIAVFFYDIFFVFITPFIFGESVMISVARGGGSDAGGDDFCFKYPDAKECTGIDFLPMLLVIPKRNDYADGSSFLGLGDIVLPGYLIAFCARYDEARRIVGKHTKIEMDYPKAFGEGYFFWMMVAYGIGLFFAFLAFVLTDVGQPALLYLVPSCLGMIYIVGKKELGELWNGPKAMRLAEKIKSRCERAWGREKMKRDVAEKKGQRTLSQSLETTQSEKGRSPPGNRGRGAAGGRGAGRGPGRGRGRGRDQDRQRQHRPQANTEKADHAKQGGAKEDNAPPEKRPQQGDSKDDPDAATDSPRDIDICFSDPAHLGTRHLRTVVKKELEKNPLLEFSPPVFKSIRGKLQGRKYFTRNQNGDWTLASKHQIRKSVAKVFEGEQRRLQDRKENETDEADE